MSFIICIDRHNEKQCKLYAFSYSTKLIAKHGYKF